MPRANPNKISEQTLVSIRELGQKLLTRRKELGISAAATAEAAGMSRVTLHRIERGSASVTMGAYLSVLSALGLQFRAMKPDSNLENRDDPAGNIVIAEYPALKRLAWQMKNLKSVTPEVALGLYERNWRHVDQNDLSDKEKQLIRKLLTAAGRKRLLV